MGKKIYTYKNDKGEICEGEWVFRCGGCGETMNQDYEYCSPCDMHGGEWFLEDENGEEQVPFDPENDGGGEAA